MGFELRVLKANHGDSILISGNFDGQYRNILIDGGPSKAFEYQNIAGDLKKALTRIKEKNQCIDLLILTHVDDDHIDGLLSGFKKNGFLGDMTKEVWFNSGKLIFEHFEESYDDSNLVLLKPLPGSNTSIGQGVKFEEYLEELHIWYHPLIKSGDHLEKFGIKFQILSPSIDKLGKLLVKWEKEHPDTLTSSSQNDYEQSFSDLLDNDEFEEDNSIHNGSSIAFIFEYEQKSILFLGDAPPSTVVESLMTLGYTEGNPLRLDYMKVSHHGSKANTNDELLKLVECDNFIISTDGSKHNLPNKKTIARIVRAFPTANLIFNYYHLVDKIFTIDELNDEEFTANSCEEIIAL